ncbi:hypothetical protein M419DRAFT_88840 [Trichoderma reesei RUT C-30]|uniref:Uncharacterized protein n=1 Tax=Hypocrea jecorina (strain ATCC 56765 / BCRC 32924 / NRRL 11460 / Rut C-30) TaxID=1344414 RepID=A0A024S207_HYPJR|nr:hypothetical protein M419DRAFT_88840 [Trichoderma reesei RUT C-30]
MAELSISPKSPVRHPWRIPGIYGPRQISLEGKQPISGVFAIGLLTGSSSSSNVGSPTEGGLHDTVPKDGDIFSLTKICNTRKQPSKGDSAPRKVWLPRSALGYEDGRVTDIKRETEATEPECAKALSKKGSNGTIFTQFHMDEHVDSTTTGISIIPPSGLGLTDAKRTSSQPDTQIYPHGAEFGPMSFGDAAEDSIFDITDSFLMKAWPTPPSILSPLEEELLSDEAKDEYYSSPNQPADRTARRVSTSMTFPSNPLHIPSATENLGLPIGVLPSSASSHSGRSITRDNLFTTETTSDNAPLDIASARALASNNATAHNGSYTHSVHGTTNAPQSPTGQDLMGTNSRGHKGATCCVTHKAEMMISEVQTLYKFGARFGFVAEDSDIQECLTFLRTRLREISQCPSRPVLCSSSSDDDEGDVDMGVKASAEVKLSNIVH